MSILPPFKANKNKLALSEREFAEEEIGELLLHECIIEAGSQPDVINPLSVSIQKSGKKRLILDFRLIIIHVFKNQFYCDISTIREIFKPGNYMFTFDLKFGYHHTDIFKDHQKFLSFTRTF